MGTFHEFIAKLQQEEEFVRKFHEAVAMKQKAGTADDAGILVSTAEEFGYSITEEELKAYSEQERSQMEELSEEEMGKVAGGSGLFTVTIITAAGVMIATIEIKERWIDKK